MNNNRPSLLHRLHAKIGDFWWYSLMVFIACRVGDCLNVFVGLWLVPKHIGPDELGAVQPLTSFAAFFAIPAAVFASTFRQEVSNLAVRREFGKMKALMRSVFIATAALFLVALVAAKIALPSFLWRIRVAEGSLALVILAAAFIGPVASIYAVPLQALKKFKATSVINIFCAPIRLATMLATMPYRALVGYFVGQCSTPAFSIATSLLALKKELAVQAEPYWNREVLARLGRLFLLFGASAAIGGFSSLVESTVIRQRLPGVDSAAFYVVTRFSEIGSYLAGVLTLTMFPFTAELAARGKSTNGLVLKASAAIVATNALLAALFWVFGRQAISLVPHGDLYADFFWAIPMQVLLSTTNSCVGLYATAELSANRFGYMRITLPLQLAYAGLLLFVTGYGYFAAHMTEAANAFFKAHNIRSLSTMLIWMNVFAAIKLVCCAMYAIRAGHSRAAPA